MCGVCPSRIATGVAPHRLHRLLSASIHPKPSFIFLPFTFSQSSFLLPFYDDPLSSSFLRPHHSTALCTGLALANSFTPSFRAVSFSLCPEQTCATDQTVLSQNPCCLNNVSSTDGGSNFEASSPVCEVIDEDEGLLSEPVNLKQKLLDVSAVLEGIGIPPSKVLSIVKNHEALFAVASPAFLCEQLALLQELGVDSKSAALAVQQFPSLLFLDLEKSLRPLLKLFEDLGLDSDLFLGKLLRYNPQKVITSGESTLQRLTKFCNHFQFSKEDTADLVRKNPLFIIFSSGDLIKRVEYLKELGLSEEETRVLIRSEPYVLTRSLEKSLKPKVGFLKELGLSERSISRIVRSQSRLFGFSIENSFKPKIEYLRRIGFQQPEIVKLLSRDSAILARSVNGSLDAKVEFLLDLGFEMGSTHLCKALRFAHSVSMPYLQQRVDWLISLGFSTDDVFLMLRRNPNLIRKNHGRLQDRIDYLVHTMNYSLQILVSYPVFLNLSLENRIKPRHRVLKWLISRNLVKETDSLCFFTSMTDKVFQVKYLDTFPECHSLFKGTQALVDKQHGGLS